MPPGIRIFLGYAFLLLGVIGLSLRWVVDQAIDAPISLPGLVVMMLLAYTIFTTTLVIQRKEAGRALALGLSTLTIPAVGHALATPCLPAKYADVVSAQVQLYDESNTLIGATSLGPDNPAIMAGTPYICRYAFSFANVPTATFYRVKIGQHDSPAASFAQLSAAGWKYDPLTLR